MPISVHQTRKNSRTAHLFSQQITGDFLAQAFHERYLLQSDKIV